MSRKELVIILAITFIVIMAWVIFDILHSKASIEIDPKIQELLTPIDPNYDPTIISEINKNLNTLSQTPVFQPEPSATPAATPTAIPTPIPSTQPLPSPTEQPSTNSATLNNENSPLP